MTAKQKFSSFRTILVPVVYGCRGRSALKAATALDSDILLIGLVRVPTHKSLSLGAAMARIVRRRMLKLSVFGNVRARSLVRVSHDPWLDLRKMIERNEPDLLLLEWNEHFDALGIPPEDALLRPPCNVGVIRGPFPDGPLRILIPLRGGPHAELALRTGLSMKDRQIATLHLRAAGKTEAQSDAPFRGLRRVLSQLPEVEKRSRITDNPAESILAESLDRNLIIMGTTIQPMRSAVSLGSVADRVFQEASAAVLAVKNRRPTPVAIQDEAAGAQAISILVDKWFAENTYHADEFADLKQLLALKERRGWTVSLALPALNEEETVGPVIRALKKKLMQEAPLLDEIVLMDSNSSDRTREIARAEGIPVYIHQELLPELPPRSGKGEALWKSLLVTRGDILLWIDTDIINIHPRFVFGILGPLLHNPQIQFVKGFYRRPLKVGTKRQAGGGGRVTELIARPLINLFYPELSGIIQPLSGEYGARRSFLEHVGFFSSYGVETGLLIDAYERYGLSAIAQVDLLERIHHNQPLEALSKMSFIILQAFLRKLERRYGLQLVEDVNKSMKLIRETAGIYSLDIEEIIEFERPPMAELPAYQAARSRLAAPPTRKNQHP
ncbi:MAG: glucosyl-3-phosphoglycerate synthase [Anaerolineales bacterium]|nr:glucosyl-3-phosphoglycerate synthase [Anaerolineales bacterium]